MISEYRKQGNAPLTLFYSYVDKDEALCSELEKHLSLLQRQGLIDGWHHQMILPGGNRNQIIEEQLQAAQIILLLISPDFLALEESFAEMTRALQRQTTGLASVIPLLLRPFDWKPALFAHLQVLPRNGKPVTTWSNRDLAFVDITKGIRSVIEQWHISHGARLNQLTQTLISIPPSPFLFLSYAHKDLSLVEHFKNDLQTHRKWAVVDYIISQQRISDEEGYLQEALRNVSAVVLVVTPSTRRSRSVRQELRIAEMYQRPIYLFWLQGNQLEEVIPTEWNNLPLFDARDKSYPQALQALSDVISVQTSPSPQLLPSKQATTPRNPYKGLQAFSTEDAQDFFGRDRLINELVDKLQQMLMIHQQNEASPCMLTVLGSSGSGKSSVVMAGLLPKLRQGAIPGSQYWNYLKPITPGQHPMEELTLTLTSLFPDRSLKSIREDLEDDSAQGLHLLLSIYSKQSKINIFLVIDQFEELFTQTTTEDERRRFLDLLLNAINEPQGPLIVVLTLRADFYDRPLLYSDLGHLIETHHVTIYPMQIRDLRAVIEGPAQLSDVRLNFEEDLIGDLLFDMQGQVGALPLLQFTLDQLFRQRQGQLLTLRSYYGMGGVKGALAKQAESTYHSLPTQMHQQMAQALFLRLINPGTVAQDATKRRILLSELTVLDPGKTTILMEVASAFTRARLLTTNMVSEAPTIEVSHEALIRAWARLEDWLHESRDAIHLQQRIHEDAITWKNHGRPRDRLYRGSQLLDALEWRKVNLPNYDEDIFLQTCVEEVHHLQALEQQQKRRTSRRLVLLGFVGIVATAGTGLLIRTLYPQNLYKTLYKSSLPPPQRLPYSYRGHTDAITSIAWSPDGKRIASAGADRTVQVWDASNGQRFLTYKRFAYGSFILVSSLDWSSDSKRIVSLEDGHEVRIWNADTGHSLFICNNVFNDDYYDLMYNVAWSPDGKHIASNGERPDANAGTIDREIVRVWDANNGHLLFTYIGPIGGIRLESNKMIAWSPESKRIVSTGVGTTLQVWDAGNGALLLTYRGHTDTVTSVTWSPDGKRIASAGADRTVQVWDASNGALLLIYKAHNTDIAYSVAWSPDGKRIASAGYDTTVQVWDANSINNPLLTYKRHTKEVWTIAWSPDGKRIASGADDAMVQVWDANTGLLLWKQYSKPLVVMVSWSPDGKHIASAAYYGSIQIWDADTGALLLTYKKLMAVSKMGIAWSPDGKYIATGDMNRPIVQVWDVATGDTLLIYKGLKETFVVSAWSIIWSPNSKRIASAGADPLVQIWDADTGDTLLTYKGHTKEVYSLAWSPDGKYIASGGYDTTVQVWDAITGNLVLTYKGHVSRINSIAWSPDNIHIASAEAEINTDVQVWNINTRDLLFAYKGHTDPVDIIAWSPDGKRIASAGADTTVQIWDALI